MIGPVFNLIPRALGVSSPSFDYRIVPDLRRHCTSDVRLDASEEFIELVQWARIDPIMLLADRSDLLACQQAKPSMSTATDSSGGSATFWLQFI